MNKLGAAALLIELVQQALLIIAVQIMYKASKKKFDEDSEFKERARKAVTQLQGGDAQFITAWERICEASRKVNPPQAMKDVHAVALLLYSPESGLAQVSQLYVSSLPCFGKGCTFACVGGGGGIVGCCGDWICVGL